jgi:hypothetical protein
LNPSPTIVANIEIFFIAGAFCMPRRDLEADPARAHAVQRRCLRSSTEPQTSHGEHCATMPR